MFKNGVFMEFVPPPNDREFLNGNISKSSEIWREQSWQTMKIEYVFTVAKKYVLRI
jgi:hypothetical protein